MQDGLFEDAPTGVLLLPAQPRPRPQRHAPVRHGRVRRRLIQISTHKAATKFYQLIRVGYRECATGGAAFCIPRVVVTVRKPE